jgi:hypothetical protein
MDSAAAWVKCKRSIKTRRLIAERDFRGALSIGFVELDEVAQVFDPVLREGWRVIIPNPVHADPAVGSGLSREQRLEGKRAADAVQGR